jgi:5-methylcytosine-specific restriction protein A
MKTCTTPGCPYLVTKGKCSECRSRYDRERGSSASRGYGISWRAIRRRYLRRNPVCEFERCSQDATEVHHLDGLGPKGDNSDANLMSLCNSHHSQITASQHRLGGAFLG